MAFDEKTYHKEYAKKNPDKIRRARKRYKASEKGKFRAYMGHIKRKYGLSEEEYLCILYEQRGLCLLCGKPMGEDICVDHDHETGEVRGLLHRLCNVGIGAFGDDIDMLERAIEYIRRFS